MSSRSGGSQNRHQAQLIRRRDHGRRSQSYDWSTVPASLRQHIGFPPFPPDHLGNSLTHLAGLVTA